MNKTLVLCGTILVANLIGLCVYDVLTQQHRIDWAKVGFVGTFVGTIMWLFSNKWRPPISGATALGIGVGVAIGQIGYQLLCGH
jgi:hypothetical protein